RSGKRCIFLHTYAPEDAAALNPRIPRAVYERSFKTAKTGIVPALTFAMIAPLMVVNTVGLQLHGRHKAVATEEILGIDIHDAIMGLKRAIENDRLRVNSPFTI